MENTLLLDYITNITRVLDPRYPTLYEVAFLKIYVKFEKYIANIFLTYCLGQENSYGYKPQRKLEFISEEQLKAVLKSENKSYIDYIKKIESLSNHLFVDNPFSIIFETDNGSLFNQMICLRNYIAHESDESRKKYQLNCLPQNIFMEAGDYLLKAKRGTTKTYFSIYIEKIKEVSELLLNPI